MRSHEADGSFTHFFGEHCACAKPLPQNQGFPESNSAASLENRPSLARLNLLEPQPAAPLPNDFFEKGPVDTSFLEGIQRNYDSISQEGISLDSLLDQASKPISPKFKEALFSSEDSLIAHSLNIEETPLAPQQSNGPAKSEHGVLYFFQSCLAALTHHFPYPPRLFVAGASTWGPDESTSSQLFGAGFDPSQMLK
jgi:hypothetical protein